VTARAEALFFGSEIYRGSSYGAWHPLAIPRVSTVIDLSRALGWLPPERFRISPRAKAAALTAWHTPAYIAALEAAEAAQGVSDEVRARHGLGTTANPVFPEMFRRPATAAGASILAGEVLAAPGVVFNPGGGTHHGMPDRANGFCYLNDAALAILSLKRAGAGRIAYVDLDAHHCDGVEHGFAADPEVTIVSVHEDRRWPFTGALTDRGAGMVWNLPVPKGFNDTEFAAVLNEVILPVVAEARPGAIVVQCGADAVEEDPLSRLSLSNRSHFRAVAALRELAPKLLVLGGGGYNPWSVARAWTGVWGVLSGQELPDRLPLEAAEVLAPLPWPRKPRFVPPEAWITTLVDAPREGPMREEVRDRIALLRARAEVWV
jgi:acetoin utilization protein AcuC